MKSRDVVLELPYEKQVFSQHGEDGIIEYLLNHLPNPSYFIEIGYGFGGTNCSRNLSVNRGMKGVAVDMRRPDIKNPNTKFWKKQVYPKHMPYMVSKFEISNVDILIIDIDSWDYWIAEELIKHVTPKIVAHEYNSFFGPDVAVTRRCNPAVLNKKDKYGASLLAFRQLYESKGYKFFGVDSSGTNCFFYHNTITIKPTKTFDFKRIHNRDAPGQNWWTEQQQDKDWVWL